MSIKQTAFAVFFVMFFSLANASTNLDLETHNASIQKGLEASVQLYVQNDSGSESQITLFATSNNQNLLISLSRDNFLLNENETTSVSLTLKPANEIPSGTYTVLVKLVSDQNIVEKIITVNVFSTNEFDFSFENNQNACIENNNLQANVTITNYGQTQGFLAYSDSEEFTPTIAPAQTTISGGASKTVKLTIPINQTHSQGPHYVPVIVKNTFGSLVEKKFEFNLNDCKNNYFDAYLNDYNLDIKQGQEKHVQLTVKNLLDKEQKIFISTESELETDTPHGEIIFLPNEQKNLEITIKAQHDLSGGEKTISFFIWNFEQSKELKLFADVNDKSFLEITLLNNEITSRICSAIDFEVFEIKLKNNSLTEDTFTVDAENDYDTIGIEFSDDEITLSSGEEKIIRVIVKPAFDAPLGEKKIILEIQSENTNDKFFEQLNFTVIAPFEESFSNVLQITSHPIEMFVFENQKKEFSISVKNNGDQPLSNLEVKIFGADEQIKFTQGRINTLFAGEEKTVLIELSTKENVVPRNYTFTIEAKTGAIKGTSNFKASIRSTKESKDQNPIITGLFGLIDFGKKNIFSLAIIIIAAGIIVMYLLQSSNSQNTGFLQKNNSGKGWAN